MDKIVRLFAIMDRLRAHRCPVKASELAAELGVSVRTLYRDMQTLGVLGAPVEGEAGVGYMLRPGFFLPPLLFRADELDALVLGARWVEEHAEPELAAAARTALGKIVAAAPDEDDSMLHLPHVSGAPRSWTAGACTPEMLATIRLSLRSEQALKVAYVDETGTETARTLWPVLLTYLESKQVLAAWCVMRSDFRLFRTDRVRSAELTPERYGRRRAALRREWDRRLRGADLDAQSHKGARS